MSFKLSRSQFLQVFAVMQSIKLINGHTSNGAAPRILWGSNNIDGVQFAALLGLISETPLMQSLKSLPPGCIAPILINPFVEGGYKMGVKTLYYHNTRDGAGKRDDDEPQNPLTQAVAVEPEDECDGACKI